MYVHSYIGCFEQVVTVNAVCLTTKARRISDHPCSSCVHDLALGMWARLQDRLVKEPDDEWVMIDASHIKVHPHASGAQGGNQEMGITKGGSTVRSI